MSDINLRFADALGKIRNAATAAEIWVCLKTFAAPFGYTHLAGVDAARLAGGATDATFYTDAPHVAPVIDRTYTYASAPFVERALRSPETFLLSELRDNPATTGKWTDLFADVVKRGDGLIVPVYSGDEPLAGFIFGGLKPDTSPLTRAMLQVLSHAAFARYREMLSDKAPMTPYALSAREVQCLRAIAGGETDGQASGRLGISARTVRFHIDNAKTKLNAKSRIQAITKALNERIITV
ncbi:MAG: autoinducer binding domain-containing protein [Alphaproteobacteria bacterium]|nr:autoinducer binding domain-containing protein [Alphaproteobacteria bacterium]